MKRWCSSGSGAAEGDEESVRRISEAGVLVDNLGVFEPKGFEEITD